MSITRKDIRTPRKEHTYINMGSWVSAYLLERELTELKSELRTAHLSSYLTVVRLIDKHFPTNKWFSVGEKTNEVQE